MLVHIFRGPGRAFGVTREEAGANLPTQFAPWAYLKSAELDRERAMPGIDSRECIDDIAEYGFHITDAHVRITHRVLWECSEGSLLPARPVAIRFVSDAEGRC